MRAMCCAHKCSPICHHLCSVNS